MRKYTMTGRFPQFPNYRLQILLPALLVVIGCVVIVVAVHPKVTAFSPARDLVTAILEQARVNTEPDVIVPGKPIPLSHMPATGPLRVNPANPRYFTDGSGRAILLTGSHTWSVFHDNGGSYPPPVFDYDAYLDFLVAHGHNFLHLWNWEQSRWTLETADENYWFYPGPPFQRTGPGNAEDGKPKWDLKEFDQSYFDRMRERTIEAGNRGIYVSIPFFLGFSVDYPKAGHALNNPWRGHPFNRTNNINNIDGDPNHDDSGSETHQLIVPAVTAIQEAYIRKVIDTVNDLDNVLYEISKESNPDSQDWQYHMINFIKDYEATKPKQHPVGMTVEYPGGGNTELFDSPADWISPNGDGGYRDDPPAADGSKVIISDTDHLWGIGGDRQWAWKSFTRGMNPVFMDSYDCAGYGVGALPDCDPNNPTWVSLRLNLGYILTYANRMNLVAMTPRADLCSTGYCLTNPAASGAEYLVYLPSGGSVTVNLSATPGQLSVEWFNPSNGMTTTGGATAGGANRSLTAPFSGDAVLYIYQSDPPTISNVAVHYLDTLAWFTWTTDQSANSQVEYGLNPTLSTSTTETAEYVTSHNVLVSGLLPDTNYVYRVHSKNRRGESATSEIFNFTTLAAEEVKRAYLGLILK
jgi:hypothetical protein